MASHLDVGKAGEKLAAAWLVQNGYIILHNNWRHAHLEVDLIALKNNLLHFVEVKYRTTTYGGYPEQAVNKKKLRDLLRAVDQYLFLHPQYNDFRLDILSITQIGSQPAEYFFIEDVTPLS